MLFRFRKKKDTHLTQLNEPFDEDYIKEVFISMCSLRKQIFSDAEQNISSAKTPTMMRKKKENQRYCKSALGPYAVEEYLGKDDY